MVSNRYLIVQRWKPNFDHFMDNFKKMTIWARILGLPIELYSKYFLWRVGNRIGKSLKVDTNILRKKEDEGE